MADRASLDEIDVAILRELQQNARIANKDLARLVFLSPSSCLQRVRALQQSGAIKGFRTEIDPHLLGRDVNVFIFVRLRAQSRHTLDTFEREMMDLSETEMLAHITGEDDVLMQIAVPDIAHLQSFILEHLTGRRDVAHVTTNVIFASRRRGVFEPLRQT
jgi:DNA-binding Lrp family transcriptional regulator